MTHVLQEKGIYNWSASNNSLQLTSVNTNALGKASQGPVADHQTGSFQVSFTVPFCNPISSSTLCAHVHVHLPGAYILNISPMQEFASE